MKVKLDKLFRNLELQNLKLGFDDNKEIRNIKYV